jgi:hypothetical protein
VTTDLLLLSRVLALSLCALLLLAILLNTLLLVLAVLLLAILGAALLSVLSAGLLLAILRGAGSVLRGLALCVVCALLVLRRLLLCMLR